MTRAHSPSESFRTRASDDADARTSRRRSSASAKPRRAARRSSASRSSSTRPYFCKAQKCERFDLAEPIPGPTTDAMQALAKELAVVLIVPLFERQARGRLPQLGGDHRRRRVAARRVSQDAHPRRPALQREVLLHARRLRHVGSTRSRKSAQASGFRVWKTRYANIGVLICWDQWYPEAARITSLLGADILFYPTAIGWHPAEKAEFGAGAGRRVAHDAARARDRERRVRRVAESRRARGRAGHERHRVLRPLVHRRSVRPAARRGGHGADDARRDVRSDASSRRRGATGRSCATAGSTPTRRS